MRFRIFCIGLFLIWVSPLFGQDKWQRGENMIVRLAPKNFSQLPTRIITDLEKRNCTIPQAYHDPKPHNVLRGEFARRGQFDWAILCSQEGVSRILVYWNSSTRRVAEFAQGEDKVYMQTVDHDGRVGFSRGIFAVDPKYILDKNPQYRRRKTPMITHQGLSDAYIEKASTVLYFWRGRWLTLYGSD